MLDLIKEVHRRRMYIIFDGVFNHVGLNFWAFRDVVEKQKRSLYKDWFKIKTWDDPAKGKKFKYQGWFGVKELPEWQQDQDGIVEGPRQYIFQATRRWMDPHANGDVSAGIDGWRLDVAFCIAHPFWQAWRRLVKSVNPQAYLTAEVIDPIPVLQPYLQGDEFDAVMNYNFAFACVEYFINKKRKTSTVEFDRALAILREAFPPAVAPVMQNLFDSHDSPRLATLIANPDQVPYREWSRYVEWSHASNPQYRWQPPNQEVRQTQKLMAIFQMTYVGAPMIYYGDEAGMYGANDPCCRKPMLWPELEYVPVQHAPHGSTPADAFPMTFDQDMFSHYQKLIRLRNNMPALQYGDFATLAADNEKQIYAFRRSLAADHVMVVLNSSNIEQTWSWQTTEQWRDVLNNDQVQRSDGSAMTITIPARWARVLRKAQPVP
jgi:cyclomaltodextrinase / maltogenic alpha-amylase / neopullulanase